VILICENIDQVAKALSDGARGVEVRAKLMHQLGSAVKAKTEDDDVALSIEKTIAETSPNRLPLILSRVVAERLVAENTKQAKKPAAAS
jgi:hypothetical protein